MWCASAQPPYGTSMPKSGRRPPHQSRRIDGGTAVSAFLPFATKSVRAPSAASGQEETHAVQQNTIVNQAALSAKFVRTVPVLPRDPRYPDKISDAAENHLADACRHGLRFDLTPAFSTRRRWVA